MAEIIPSGAGSVETIVHDEYDSAGDYIGYHLELRATPAEGYRFDHFEWEYQIYWDGDYFPPQQGTKGSELNPEPNGPLVVDFLTRYQVYRHYRYSGLKAYFTLEGGSEPEPGEKYTVAISVSPTNGGTVAGGGEYESGAICTLTANYNAGYELLRLVNDADGTTIYPPNPPQCFGKTIEHSFPVSKDSTWIAYFRACTNAILRGKSGNILRGQGGNILRDW